MEAQVNYGRANIVNSMSVHQVFIRKTSFFKSVVLRSSPRCMGFTDDISLRHPIHLNGSLNDLPAGSSSQMSIVAQKTGEFSEALSLAMLAIIPEAAGIILDLLIESRTTTPETNDLKI